MASGAASSRLNPARPGTRARRLQHVCDARAAKAGRLLIYWGWQGMPGRASWW